MVAPSQKHYKPMFYKSNDINQEVAKIYRNGNSHTQREYVGINRSTWLCVIICHLSGSKMLCDALIGKQVDIEVCTCHLHLRLSSMHVLLDCS